ncbi:hypothetical protein BY996DRAFT_8439468 [Phakopsora pachyrhizi]|nr:hypothetical protein BY996DRAFT_8439468 [Phakopsora pachyrhizi]
MDSYSTEDSSRIISKVSKLTTVVVRFNQSSIKLIYPINFISKHWINLGLEPIGSRKNLDCDDCLEFYEEHHKIDCGDSINKDYVGWNTVIKSESTEFLIRLQVRNSSRGIEDEVLKVFDRLLEEEVDKITFNLIRVSTNRYRRIPDGSLTSKSEESSRTQGRCYFVKISNGTDESRKLLDTEALRKSEPTADQLDIADPTNAPLADGARLKAERTWMRIWLWIWNFKPEGLCEFLLKMLPGKVLRYSHFWHIPIILEKVCDRFSMAMMAMTTSDGKRARELVLTNKSLMRQTESVVSSFSNQQRFNNLRLVGLLTRLRPSLTRKKTSNSTQIIGSEEPQPLNQTIDPESINHQSESTTVSILSSQQMTVVNLQHSSSSSLPVSLRLPLSPTTSPRPTPKSKSTKNTKPTAIRPHTPDLTSSMPESPSQINLANLMEKWSGGGPSELSYRLPDPPSPIPAFEINLSTYHQVLGQTVDPKPLPNHNLPQCTPEHLPNHQSSSKLEIEHKDKDSEEEDDDDDDDVLGNEKLYSTQTHLSPKDEILPISGPLREVKTNEMVRIIKEQALKIEEERHWLTSKLVKLTSSNQVLERGKM